MYDGRLALLKPYPLSLSICLFTLRSLWYLYKIWIARLYFQLTELTFLSLLFIILAIYDHCPWWLEYYLVPLDFFCLSTTFSLVHFQHTHTHVLTNILFYKNKGIFPNWWRKTRKRLYIFVVLKHTKRIIYINMK